MQSKVQSLLKKLAPMLGTNASDIYNSHLYWSQKPFNICDEVLEALTTKGDVVCDPFLGSGVSLIESLKKGKERNFVGVEVNDYPIFLVNTLLGKYDLKELYQEYLDLKNKVQNLQAIYLTHCPTCGQEHIITKILFNYNKDRSIRLDTIFFKCGSKIMSKTPDKHDENLFFSFDMKTLKSLKNIKLLENSRLAVKANETLFDIFTKRNLVALDKIMQLCENSKFHNIFLYSLLGIIHLAKITDLKSSSQWPLWTPHADCIEKNVFSLFLKSLEKTLLSLNAVNKHISPVRDCVKSVNDFSTASYLILQKGIQNISAKDVPDNTVDLVITDPPYLGQVIYSEYMQLYQPFLKNCIDYESEIVVSKTKNRNKTKELYYQELDKAFAQISRILKPKKIMAIYFHDANLSFWVKFFEMMAKHSFNYLGQVHIHKSKSTIKNILSPKKSLNGDSLLFFSKEPIKKGPNCNAKLNPIDQLKEISYQIIKAHNGKATTAQLYDNGTLEYLVRNRKLEEIADSYKDLTEIFETFLQWNPEGYWTI